MIKFTNNSKTKLQDNIQRGVLFGLSIMLLFAASSCKKAEEAVPTFETSLRLTAGAETIQVGSTFQFKASFDNGKGEKSTDNIEWKTSDAEVISISSTGLAEALKAGAATLTASREGKEQSISVTAGAETVEMKQQRQGQFQGRANYTVSGQVDVVQEEDGSVTVTLADDFTSSTGPGLYLYLSTSATSIASFENLGMLRDSNGGIIRTFTIPASKGVNINDFDFVQVWCQPFGVTFGFSKLN